MWKRFPTPSRLNVSKRINFRDAQRKALQADVERFAKTFVNKKLNGSYDNAVVKGVRVTWDNDGDPNIEFKLDTTPIKEK